MICIRLSEGQTDEAQASWKRKPSRSGGGITCQAPPVFAFEFSPTASAMLSRSAAGRLAASGSSDGPKGFAAVQAVASAVMAVRRKPGEKAVPT
jgi:hypothetical protein